MKWLSRKFCLAIIGMGLYSGLPVLYKNAGVSDPVSLAGLAGLTLIIGYYFKLNVTAKTLEEKVSVDPQ